MFDAVWGAVRALLPAAGRFHPLGCHRPRICDEVCFRGLMIPLVTGASWVDVEAIMGFEVSDTTLRARRDEWIAAGVFDELCKEASAAFDRIVGLDLEEVALDGSLHKAPCGGEDTGPNPTDRSKIGWKWSVASEHHGRHADFETHQGDHASVEPDRSWPSAGSHTLGEPTEAAGGSRANPANDLPDATTSQPHRPVPTYKSAVQFPAPQGGAVDSPDEAVGTIIDNDDAPEVSVSDVSSIATGPSGLETAPVMARGTPVWSRTPSNPRLGPQCAISAPRRCARQRWLPPRCRPFAPGRSGCSPTAQPAIGGAGHEQEADGLHGW